MGFPMPIIKLEVEQMKHFMMVALSEYTTQIDETLKLSIEAYCTPENLQRVIGEEVQRTLNLVIREQVKNWFTFGEGHRVVKEAVEQKLKDGITWTPLDRVTEED